MPWARPMSAYSVAICSCAYLPLLACACLSAAVSSAPAASAPMLQTSSDTVTETGVWVPDILTTTLPSPVEHSISVCCSSSCSYCTLTPTSEYFFIISGLNMSFAACGARRGSG